jgi:cell division protein ZapA
MAGLMLADKTAGLDEQLRRLEDKIATQNAWIEELQTRGGAAPAAAADLSPVLEDVAERAERLAATLEAKLAS